MHASGKPITFPPFKDRVAHLAEDIGKAAGSVIQGQKFLVSEELYEKRMTTCHACPMFHKGRCALCSCFMSLKSRIQTFNCPLGKW
jgi:hypothetical protein